jgi:translocator assembly and maintenance protein 41
MLAYGSGAVPQAGYANAKEQPMLDLVLVVEDAVEWHRANIAINRSHYSALALGGPNLITKAQRMAAGVYYNTLVPMKSSREGGGSRLMKYGVVSRVDLEDDLNSWRWLYLSGRLHKPVLLSAFNSDSLQSALRVNLSSSVRAALLLLPAEFIREDLYLAIAGLSYGGDLRMLFGENPDKVSNIVRPNLARFDDLYNPILKDFAEHCDWNVGSDASTEKCSQDTSMATRRLLVESLPSAVRFPSSDASPGKVLTNQLRSVVRKSSSIQSAKGILTAGPVKSATYTGAKIGKWAAWQVTKWSKRLRP